jgi:prepilin peptidase CpaA
MAARMVPGAYIDAPIGWNMVTDAVRMLLFPALMAFAASSDLITMTISNRISLILIAGFFVLAFMIGMPLNEIGMHIGAAFAVLVVSFIFFARGWIGGGDAKLAAATALWLGFDQLLNYLIFASLFGGLLTLAILRFRAMPLPSLLANQDWAKRLHRMDTGVPYGIALALAALVIYPNTPWMKSLGM